MCNEEGLCAPSSTSSPTEVGDPHRKRYLLRRVYEANALQNLQWTSTKYLQVCITLSDRQTSLPKNIKSVHLVIDLQRWIHPPSVVSPQLRKLNWIFNIFSTPSKLTHSDTHKTLIVKNPNKIKQHITTSTRTTRTTGNRKAYLLTWVREPHKLGLPVLINCIGRRLPHIILGTGHAQLPKPKKADKLDTNLT